MLDETLTRQMAEDLAIAFGGNDPALRWVDRRLADGPLRAREVHQAMVKRYAELGGNGRPHEGGSTSTEVLRAIAGWLQ